MPNLLLVEDDTNLGELLQEYLIDKGYPTDLATDGQKGWQCFVVTNMTSAFLTS
jgi:DNA-binding response OmpR family regulator